MSTRLIFAGTPEFSATSLNALIEQQAHLDIELVAVYTQPDKKSGRGQKMSQSPVKQLALAHDIPVEQPATFKLSSPEGQQARQRLLSYDADVMVVAAYGLILPVGVLNTPRMGCLNIHASLLPRWRGAAPIHRAILAGDTQTGITIMQMDKGLDTGDMLYRVECGIDGDETADSLHDKLATLGSDAICTVLADLARYQQQAQPQNAADANYADKLSKAEGRIDWTKPASHIERQIRGLSPWPGTYAFVASADAGQYSQAGTGGGEPDNNQRIKILASMAVNPSQMTTQPAGTVISVGRNAILVACGKQHPDDEQATTIRLTRVQFAGGKPLTAEQVCQGNQINDGDILL